MKVTSKVLVATNPGDLFGAGQQIVSSLVEQAGQQGMGLRDLETLIAGLFSGSVATLQVITGDEQVRLRFEAFLSAPARPAGKGH